MPSVLNAQDVSYQEDFDLEDEVQPEVSEFDSEAFCETEETGESHKKEEYYKQCMWDAKSYVHICIGVFFKDKAMYCGGPVPKRLLQSEDYMTLVLNTDVEYGAKTAYAALQRAEHQVTWETDDAVTVPREVKFVISILNHCKTLDIPKVFAPGLMLMYLEICEGVNVIGRT